MIQVGTTVLRIYRQEDALGELRTLTDIERIETQLTPDVLERLFVVPVKPCEDASHE